MNSEFSFYPGNSWRAENQRDAIARRLFCKFNNLSAARKPLSASWLLVALWRGHFDELADYIPQHPFGQRAHLAMHDLPAVYE